MLGQHLQIQMEGAEEMGHLRESSIRSTFQMRHPPKRTYPSFMWESQWIVSCLNMSTVLTPASTTCFLLHSSRSDQQRHNLLQGQSEIWQNRWYFPFPQHLPGLM